MRFTSLLVGGGYRRQPTPRPSQEGRGRQETEEMGMSEEVGVRIVRVIILPNYAPKILTF
ncbi:MAG: hypothetical protein F6K24_06890 [Okeania sp. SIO2D1]|nr:hypothetical protein [Okeania sp. SIO2D1]